MNKLELLSELKANMLPNGTSQFNFSTDLRIKHTQQEILKVLESEGLIEKLTITLGYAIYRVL